MKNYLTLIILVLLTVVCQAQVGINTPNPRGALNLQNVSDQNLGLVLPHVDNVEAVTATDQSTATIGTIVYDVSRAALCVKLENGWNCFDENCGNFVDETSTPSLPDFGKDGNTMAVGAYRESSKATGVNGNENIDTRQHAGAVYILVRNASGWSQQAYVKPSNTDAGDSFG